jgi:isopenicillin N synthase-like dioxygenase
MDRIPVVDFGPLSTDNGRVPAEADWGLVSQEIDRVLTDIGFVYLKNHGVSQKKASTLYTIAKYYRNIQISH